MISSNVSSIQAHQSWMNNSADNVANVNSDRYRPKDTTLQNANGQNVTANTTVADNTGSQRSQTNLAKEMPDQISIQRGVEANANAIKTQNDFFGTLLDIKA